MGAGAQAYWEANAEAHTFAHPLDFDWLAGLGKHARILDFGCGYGRLTAELAAAGWEGAVGADFSAGMIARGRRAHPGLNLRHIDGLPLAEPDGAFDAALLVAVLTCIPDDAGQRALIAELARLIRPGGLLCVSDYPLQDDARHAARYAAGRARHGVYGVWDRDDGGVFRHHAREHLAALLAGFERVAERAVETTTLSGAKTTAIQLLMRKPA
jgi:SAM-dependent methyltransferase